MFNPDAPISTHITLSAHVSPSVVKTTGGDFLLTWRLGGLPFVGREEWELEHRHNTFNRMLQTLRAPDYTNVAFWVHDIRRRRAIRNKSKFDQAFNQTLSDAYYEALSSQKLMQNELYLTMMYRPVVQGKAFAEKSSDVSRLESEQAQAIAQVLELAGNIEAVLRITRRRASVCTKPPTVSSSPKYSPCCTSTKIRSSTPRFSMRCHAWVGMSTCSPCCNVCSLSSRVTVAMPVTTNQCSARCWCLW